MLFFKIICFPFTLLYYICMFMWHTLEFFFNLMKLLYYTMMYIGEWIVKLIFKIFNLPVSKNSTKAKTKINKTIKETIVPSKVKERKKSISNWTEDEFEKEADLWGLSKEDRRIAKEERMSPADYIEAEERDDDELFTDEWK